MKGGYKFLFLKSIIKIKLKINLCNVFSGILGERKCLVSDSYEWGFSSYSFV